MHEGRKQTNTWSAYAGSRLELSDALGRRRPKRHPSSRTGENPPYGMIGGIEETSASFEARSAPRSYPTEGESRMAELLDRDPHHIWNLLAISARNRGNARSMILEKTRYCRIPLGPSTSSDTKALNKQLYCPRSAAARAMLTLIDARATGRI
jgi:hypothetical protein